MEIRVNARYMTQSLAIKIEAISERETNVSKLGKMAAQPTLEADFDSTVYIDTDGACRCIYLRA